jgi:hypothetical protein
MNKHVKISLIVLVTVVLLLAIAIPALARIQRKSCGTLWMAYDAKLDESVEIFIFGEGEFTLTGNTLIRTCNGNIPLGEAPIKPWLTYFDLDEMRGYLCDTYGGDACDIGTPFTIGPDETGGYQDTDSYKGDECTSYDWELVVKRNGDFESEILYSIE